MWNRKLYLLLLPAIMGILACRLLSPTPSFANRNDTAKIYFSIDDTLYRMNLDGSKQETVSRMATKSVHVFVDNTYMKVYVTHWSHEVFVLDLKDNTQTFIQAPEDWGGGQGIAFDPKTSDLFMGLYYDGVHIKNLTKNEPWQQLVSPASLSPLLGHRGQLQVDPTNRQIYFKTAFNGDCGLCRYIYRVDYDGKNLTKIIPANGGDDLALDLIARKMYFSNAPENATIMRANLDGSNLETVFSVPLPYSALANIVLDLQEQKIYMSLYDVSRDWKAKAISRVNFDGTGYEILYETTGDSGDAVSGGIGLFLP
jgi:hypothetical protein